MTVIDRAQESAIVTTRTAGAVSPKIVAAQTNGERSETYASLLTRIDLQSGSTPGRTLGVVAVDETCDAPAVAANLAVASARYGDQTLLVDADLAAPSLHGLLGGGSAPGLTAVLAGETTIAGAVQTTAIPSLYLLPAGSEHGTRVRLDRHGDLDETCRALRESADRVVFLASPISDGAGIVQLGLLLDGVILVLAAGKTRRSRAARARDLLEAAGLPLLGVVLTTQ